MSIPPQVVIISLSLLAIWLTIITCLLIRAYQTYKRLTSGIDKKDFAQVLISLKKDIQSIEGDLDDFRDTLRDTNKALKTYIQKIGFIRYNPFGNTGGDQSFCLCLLDQQDNGILLTSLHARDQTRIYTKEIKNGHPKDKNPLSKEESECIKQAKKWSSKK